MPKKQQNLETALKELEKIVDDLNSSDIDIEKGLKKFKKGAELIKFCKQKLKKAENEFEKLRDELE